MSTPISFPGAFTLLMAVYKGDDVDLFERALQSVFDNTLQPDEFILVVDGPIPKALNLIIQLYQEKFNTQVIYLPVNKGLSHALNAGLAKVRTDWVVRADADDINLPDRFMLLANVASGTEAPDLIGGAINEIDRNGNILTTRRTPLSHFEIVQFAKYRNPFNHMSVAYSRKLALQCGGYPHIYLREDYALWANMLSKGAKTLNLPDVLIHATAGHDLNLRRGGWRYAWAELELQRHLVKCKIKSPFLCNCTWHNAWHCFYTSKYFTCSHL